MQDPCPVPSPGGWTPVNFNPTYTPLGPLVSGNGVWIAPGKFDSDADIDAVLTKVDLSGTPFFPNFYINDSSGGLAPTFTEAEVIPLFPAGACLFGDDLAQIEAADVNADGLDDVIVCCNGSVLLFLNTGGSFATTGTILFDLPGGGFVTNMDLVDFDGDTLVDVVISHDETIRWVQNLGVGVFSAPLGVGSPNSNHYGCTADLDNDGDLDVIAYTSTGSGGVLLQVRS